MAYSTTVIAVPICAANYVRTHVLTGCREPQPTANSISFVEDVFNDPVVLGVDRRGIVCAPLADPVIKAFCDRSGQRWWFSETRFPDFYLVL